ncbi:Uncharacterised protein [Salmonella enterica subsp. enterica]|uniref:Uncharacterized protein n=1 Tax=Salmonella enterica I TaxID=59201 RepID=A0A379WYH4_SALET|nr:Uncharacterised protein [Salmonella enterica subsp. enterica]
MDSIYESLTELEKQGLHCVIFLILMIVIH